MDWKDFVNNSLWPVLVDTVHSMVMFLRHKAYVKDFILVEQPDISAEDLALKLGISLGESMVILCELREVKTS